MIRSRRRSRRALEELGVAQGEDADDGGGDRTPARHVQGAPPRARVREARIEDAERRCPSRRRRRRSPRRTPSAAQRHTEIFEPTRRRDDSARAHVNKRVNIPQIRSSRSTRRRAPAERGCCSASRRNEHRAPRAKAKAQAAAAEAQPCPPTDSMMTWPLRVRGELLRADVANRCGEELAGATANPHPPGSHASRTVRASTPPRTDAAPRSPRGARDFSERELFDLSRSSAQQSMRATSRRRGRGRRRTMCQDGTARPRRWPVPATKAVRERP